jgi:hypothetical protein
MADDNWPLRPRAPDPFRRAVEPPRAGEPASGGDPLAELARLIGKNDPYAEFGLTPSRQDHEQESYSRDASAYDDQQYGSSQEGYEQPYAHSDDPCTFERYPESREGYAVEQDLPAAHDAYVDRRQSEHARSYDLPESTEHQSSYAPSHHAYADEREHGGHYIDEEESLDGYTEQIYDDAPRAARRGGLTTALALIGCAMLGTAGAYAYRSYSARPAAAVPPPVITADNTTPTKIIPAPSSDSQSGKIVSDRVADAGREQVVSNQEEPVPTREIGTQAAPRVVLPAPVAPLASGPGPGQSSMSSGTSSADSKRVRTLTIRPDGTEVNASPRAPVQQGVTPGAGATSAKGSAPLSLDPQGGEQTRAPTAKTRIATAPPSARPESATNPSGRFLVQLSSQRTETEAAASFRSLQAKFPNELSGRSPIVRRADLGSKGVFYRTMVGPFTSAQEAHQFCATLKAAGGHCIVPNE